MANENIEEIKLKKGETTTECFKGLATAGYEWNYTINGNSELVNISKDFTMPSKSNKVLPGASSDEVFTIKANKEGIVNIYFFQKRSWEKNVDPANEKNVKIIIE